MRRFLTHIISNTIGLYLLAQLMSGVAFAGEAAELVLVGLVLGLINFTIKPVVKFFSMPFIILSFGLFLIVINMAMLKILTILAPNLIITDLFSLFWATIFLGLINFTIGIIFKVSK